MRLPIVTSVILSLFGVSGAAAQERSLNFALRGGVSAAPEYFGSDQYRAGPDISFEFGALKWGGRQIGSGIWATPETGLTLKGAFRIIGTRSVADSPELAGLADIDAALELGLALNYQQRDWRAFGELRRGFGGHEGITGTIGADWILRPATGWTIYAGPRMNFGSDRFAATYFGITAADAATSQFAAFEAGGGMLGAGVEVSARYQFDERWALEGALGYERLLNDAAASPITQLGSDDQWRLRIGVSRAFTIGF
jgi:outer membrane protein